MQSTMQLYKKGINVFEAIEQIDNSFRYLNVEATPGDKIKRYCTKIDQITNPQYVGDEDVTTYLALIKEQEKILFYFLKEELKSGRLWGFGFNKMRSPIPTIIPPNEWRFLNLDIKNQRAEYVGSLYTDLRFIHSISIEQKERIALIAKYFPNSVEEENGDVDLAEKSSFRKQKRENQLHTLIWRVYKYLRDNGKESTAQSVWNEIKNRYINHDINNIINTVNSELIEWTSSGGIVQTLQRSSFDKTLSTIKKNYR